MTTTTTPNRWLPLSKSRHADMQTCLYLAWLKHVMRAPVPPSDAAERGHEFHAQMQNYITTGTADPASPAYEAANKTWLNMLAAGYRGMDAIGTEIPFTLSGTDLGLTNDDAIMYSGRLDAVFSDPPYLRVLEFKSGQSYATPDSIEAPLYAVAAAQIATQRFGKPCPIIYSVISPHDNRPADTVWSPAELKQAADRLIAITSETAHLAPLQTPGDHCTNYYGTICPYFDRCPAHHDLPSAIAEITPSSHGATSMARDFAALGRVLRNDEHIDPATTMRAYSAITALQRIQRQGTAALKKHLALHPQQGLAVVTSVSTQYDAEWLLNEMENRSIPVQAYAPYVTWHTPTKPTHTDHKEAIEAAMKMAPQKLTKRHYLKELAL